MLTTRKRMFIEAFKTSKSAANAARFAGYSEKTIQKSCKRILNDVDISRELQIWEQGEVSKLEEIRKSREITKDVFVEKMMTDYETVSVESANRPRFADLAGKALGFIGNNQPSVVNNTQINIKTDVLSLNTDSKWSHLRDLLES